MLDIATTEIVDSFKVFGRSDEQSEWREIAQLLLEGVVEDTPAMGRVQAALKQRRAKLRTAAQESKRPARETLKKSNSK
jgi:hypothetical protein